MDDDDRAIRDAEQQLEHTTDELEERLERLDDHIDERQGGGRAAARRPRPASRWPATGTDDRGPRRAGGDDPAGAVDEAERTTRPSERGRRRVSRRSPRSAAGARGRGARPARDQRDRPGSSACSTGAGAASTASASVAPGSSIARCRMIGPGVHARVDEVHGHAEDLHAVVERLLDRAQPGEGGQQRRVDVDDAPRRSARRTPRRGSPCSRRGRRARRRAPPASRPSPRRAPRGRGYVAAREDAPSARPAARARSQRRGVRLVGADARRSRPRGRARRRAAPAGSCPRPRRARRPQPLMPPSARLAAPRAQLRVAPAGRRQPPGREQRVDAVEHRLGRQVGERAVARAARRRRSATAFERPPRRISTARVRPTAARAARDDVEDRGVERRAGRRAPRRAAAPARAARPRRRRGHERPGRRRRSTAPCGAGAAGSPKWRRIAARRQRVALDERPDRAVLAPARALRLAPPTSAAAPRARGRRRRREPPAHAVHRRRRGLQDARARQVADDRPDALGLVVERGDRATSKRPSGAEATSRRATPSSNCVVDLGALDEEDVQALVARLGEQQGASRGAVAARAPGLLVVGLDRRRHDLVCHGAHVGLVDAHAERVGGDDDVDLAGHEAPLDGGALVARQPRVVGSGPRGPGRPAAARSARSAALRVPA